MNMSRPIDVSTSIAARFEQARLVLCDDPGAVFGGGATDEEHKDLFARTVLSVELGAGASLHQEVALRLGDAQLTETAVVMPVAWQATGRKRLFPTFTGVLEATHEPTGTRLRLHGTFTVPLGAIGRFANGVGGWHVAHRSLHALLARLGQRLEIEVDSRSMSRGASLEAVAHEADRSEFYIG
jgi:hypothetical protein